MENEYNFQKLPKVSIKSLLNENFFEDIFIIKNGSNNATLTIVKDGRDITLSISKKTVEKINKTNNYDKIIMQGHIVLINSLLSTHSLRFYTNEYQNLEDYFETVNYNKKTEQDRELIKQVMLRH